MSTLLSTYKNINGVLEQDVMAGGVIQAYKAAGRPLPIMTGDYTFHFLREWADTYPSLDSIGVDYQPGIVIDALKITVQLLEGKHFKPGVLQGNPINPSLKNAVLVNAAYVVTKHAEPNAPWMQGIKDSKAISLKEAVALGQGKPAGDSLDGWLSNAEVNALFKK
jgi:ribose transport system substrate-binding protein